MRRSSAAELDQNASVAPPDDPEGEALAQVIERVAHLLPAQGPLGVFVHHNTLHAFEDRSFERAVREAGELFGCEPYLPEAAYRDALRTGRIRRDDLQAVVVDDLQDRATQQLGGFVSRAELYLAVLRHGLTPARGRKLAWLIAESDAVSSLRDDLHSDARERLLQRACSSFGRELPVAELEHRASTALWSAARKLAATLPLPPAATAPRLLRHRDLLFAATGVDSDELVHPLLIRWTAAFVDQGLAYWPMPGRERGLYHAFLDLYGSRALHLDPYLRAVGRLARAERQSGRDARTSLLASLKVLGVGQDELEPFLRDTALALRGWAGLLRQLEVRPDRVPVHAPPASLRDFLALRLLLERAALAVCCQGMREVPSLAALRARLEASRPAPAVPSELDRAFVLFEATQLLGRSGAELEDLAPEAAAELLQAIEELDATERRRLWHQAYERRYRHELLDALGAAQPRVRARGPLPLAPGEAPSFQLIGCIDERVESVRRHLEEIDPRCETLGVAGFFGVSMYYRGLGAAHPRPLCPVSIQPRHEVEEQPTAAARQRDRRHARSRRALGQLTHGTSVGSRTLVRGTVISTLVGLLAALPLVFRVLFPRATAWLRRGSGSLIAPPRQTELLLAHRPDVQPTLGQQAGYRAEEMAEIVADMLTEIGLLTFSRIVVVLGHGSSSLNNPHESAHDCGACGGGRGGPNARAFARMANDPEVRALLATRGLALPADTHFVGAEHNTCDDHVSYYDLDALPKTHHAALAHACKVLDEARARDAQERCRRYENAKSGLSGAQALAHVAGRAEDLAQPRPEYGHATNAACVVGRRSRTRGLFLDRRVFLNSYDPTTDDDDASILTRLLAAVVPVVAGINLEYYFSRVDNNGYGCGSKLPHNITGLLGVMDGQLSDLRTGLPWQMVEIHEPVRLLLVIECRPEALRRVLARDATFRRLLAGRWLYVATLDPDGSTLHEIDSEGVARPYQPETTHLEVTTNSLAWTRGRRDHLPPAWLEAMPARRQQTVSRP